MGGSQAPVVVTMGVRQRLDRASTRLQRETDPHASQPHGMGTSELP